MWHKLCFCFTKVTLQLKYYKMLLHFVYQSLNASSTTFILNKCLNKGIPSSAAICFSCTQGCTTSKRWWLSMQLIAQIATQAKVEVI